jgi:hypothetical protein
MNTGRMTWVVLVLFSLVSSSCCNPPEEPVHYTRLVIDTYKPTGLPAAGTADTFLSLFDAGGEAGPAIAEADGGNPNFLYAARIDYTDPVGFTSGTVLYVRVKFGSEAGGIPGAYAIRLVTDPAYDSSWNFASAGDDSEYEPDDAVTGGIPDNPALLSVGGKLNRALADASDVDWLQLVLP